MSIWQELALPKSLEDYLDERDRIQGEIRKGYDILHQADKECRESIRHGLDSHSLPWNRLDKALADVDRKFWRMAFDLTGFRQYMDAEAHEQFEKELCKETPPEFTRDNIVATFGDLIQSAGDMWRRGVVNLFRKLEGHYKTNSAFRITPKIIMEGAAQPRFMGGREIRFGMMADRVNDLDRVLRTIDGEEHESRALESAMNERFQHFEDYEDERIKARVYKNGNIHLWFKQQHHIDRINRIIAEHYGETLPDDRSAA